MPGRLLRRLRPRDDRREYPEQVAGTVWTVTVSDCRLCSQPKIANLIPTRSMSHDRTLVAAVIIQRVSRPRNICCCLLCYSSGILNNSIGNFIASIYYSENCFQMSATVYMASVYLHGHLGNSEKVWKDHDIWQSLGGLHTHVTHFGTDLRERNWGLRFIIQWQNWREHYLVISIDDITQLLAAFKLITGPKYLSS